MRAAKPLQALALSAAAVFTMTLGFALTACGGPPPAPLRTPADDSPPIGLSAPGTGVGREPAAEGAIELALRRADGAFIDVGELRGHIVVLLLLATFDGPSQMALRPLRNLAERSPEIRILGIAAQHSARLLVDAYEHALHPPFPVTYDPEETVTAGTSMLGELSGVPTIVVLDPRGLEVGRYTGFCDDACLEQLVAQAR